MKLFIDSADVQAIKRLNSYGIIDGVTTNPSLIAKEGRDFKQVVKEITLIVNGPISAEVISTTAEGMLKEAEELLKIHPNIVIKIPIIAEGLKAIKVLSEKNVKTNATLCFSANQALLVAKAGATYVSPFIGRLDDSGETGMQLIQEIKTIYDNYGFETKILAASIRSPLQVKEAAMIGADAATCPVTVLNQLVKHPLTDVGLQKFLDDWERAGKK